MPDLHLPGSAESVPVARRIVSSDLAGATGLTDDHLFAIRLIVSELVANAVVHGQSDVTVSWSVAQDRIRVEVCDDSSELPTPVRAAPVDERGRGLALVSTVASRFGWDPLGSAGKAVWAEVDLPV